MELLTFIFLIAEQKKLKAEQEEVSTKEDTKQVEKKYQLYLPYSKAFKRFF